ncbi:ferric uptake regulator, Fur family [Acidimicrobium ferrooxidans DSM 10331]|uniref:Ferric uptake regulator, Fur family n=1 Tax=Acidimicrobium ferrooxidans (strain DSM 10331 / JCM 15462 / NBRC 103882 / ICP) TaxID=525909 RepID=C7M068_ACIFD|nr:Fur family transcriptional regulator [Acidimicrobium ferrooxidans]ACU54376.1 ferric uptake regulator, Fur family [Acidimicrobium ferrooxidans DSM 10331]
MAETQFEGALRQRGLRVTDERRAVFRVLAEAGRPLTRAELVDVLAEAGVGSATAYRTIAAFAEAGIVQPVTIGDDIAYELLPPYASHHHHFHCVSCGEIFEVRVASCQAITIDDAPGPVLYHQVEAYGVCERCISARPRGVLPSPSGSRER